MTSLAGGHSSGPGRYVAEAYLSAAGTPNLLPLGTKTIFAPSLGRQTVVLVFISSR